MLSATPAMHAVPSGLGFAAFGLTTVSLSLVNAGLLPPGGLAVVLPLALVFGGLVQIIVGICEFRLGNTFGVTSSCSYGAFWLWFALMSLFEKNHFIDISAAGPTTGAILITWGVVTFLFWISTFCLPRVTFIVFLTLWIDYLLLGLGACCNSLTLTYAGGWVGILCGSTAIYGSFAIVTNATFGYALIPTGSPLFNCMRGD
ncbi:acetate uptake transporter [Enterobacter hormaechei]|uniref:acetate uptake transporter n=1 Tax=Enterobacter hormaechei TaxID=158836 RepID=UPI0009B5731D|nr:GPR1/FUN34/YaaH family transporter [Enterobacter hormaechei]